MMVPRWMQDLSRADFLRSAGLYITRDSLYLAQMRKSLFQVSLVGAEAKEIPTQGDEATRRQAMVGAIRSLLADFNLTRDRLYICLSSDQTLGCEILLPEVAEDNVRQVLDYEIERFLPFRRDEIYYDFLPLGKKGKSIRLFLYAVPRRILDGILDGLRTLGIQPAGVETTATTLCNYLVFCAGGIPGSTVVAARRDGYWEMVGLGVRHGGWRQEVEILFDHQMPRADWVRGPGRELIHALRLESPRFFACGPVEDLLPSLNGESIQIEDLTQLAKERVAAPGGRVQPAFVPAIGAALRGLREASLQINLWPNASGEERGERMVRWNGLLAVVLLVSLVAWGVSYPIKNQIRMRQLESEITRLEPAVGALQAQEEKLNRLRKEMALLTERRQGRGEILRILDELSRVVPDSAYLSNLRFRDGTLEVRGSAENASTLVPLLERSPMLKNVGFNAPTNRGRDNRESFSLKAEIER